MINMIICADFRVGVPVSQLYSRVIVSQLAKLKATTSRKELAWLLGYTPASLTAIIYKTPNEQNILFLKLTRSRVANALSRRQLKNLKNFSYTFHICSINALVKLKKTMGPGLSPLDLGKTDQ